MLRLADIRIRPKLLFLFVFAGVFPLLIVGYLNNKWMEESLIKESFSKLTTIQNIRKGQIENYFQKSFVDIRILADSERIFKFIGIMNRYEEEMETSSFENLETDNPKFARILRNVKKPLQDYSTLNGYQDLYLIDAEHGHVMFSLQGRDDRGTNLIHGPYKDSALGRIWQKVKSSSTTVIVDFEPYEPADNVETAFIGHPVANKSGETIGVVVLRFNAELVSRITESRKGMGRTGESYLLGWLEDEDTFELRSELKTMGDGKYVVGFNLGRKLDYWIDAFKAGEQGGNAIYIDSVGHDVLVAYNKLNIKGLDWFLISKIDKYEVTEPIRLIRKNAIIVALCLVVIIAIGAMFFSRTITRPIIADMEFADAISHGDLSSELHLEQKDELGDLARSLNSMARNLEEADWLTTGREMIEDEIRGEFAPVELAQRYIDLFVNYLDADLGAIYLYENNLLTLSASNSFSDRDGLFQTFAIGEGMVGQAALDGEIKVFSNSKEATPVLNYGAGEPTRITAIKSFIKKRGIIM